MKKLLVILAIVLLPLSAFAGMSAITDSEMAAVTGQMGVSIAIVDQQQDLSLAALTWGDVNTAAKFIAGYPTSMNPGYININNIAINKNTTTLNGVAGTNGVFADPLKIDVVSVGALNMASTTGGNKFAAFINKTAVIISLADSVQTIDSISIGSITLDTAPATVQVITSTSASVRGTSSFYSALNAGAQYAYTNTFAQLNSHQLGQLYIQGFKQIGYSHLEGYIASTSGNVTLPVSNRPGFIAIFAHDAVGN